MAGLDDLNTDATNVTATLDREVWDKVPLKLN